MSLPFVGPSYTLATRKAAIDRAVNMYLVGMETPGKAPWIMESIPGLIQRWSLGAEIRGSYEVGSRAFIVAGSTLYEVFSDYTSTARGTLATSSGQVSMAYGLTQLVIVDGAHGYVLTLATDVFQTITDPDFPGSETVQFLDNYFLFIHPETQQFFISAINDATSFDALDFASAESSPDDLVAVVVDHEEAWLFGELTTEVWANTGGADFPFSKRGGATMEVGLAAVHSAKKVDSALFWIGRDANGTGMVYRSQVYQQKRISTAAVERALLESTDLSAARAWAMQRNGKTFYVICAPGLSSCWAYEVASDSWHEWCDLGPDGQLVQHRGQVHLHAFNKHFLGDADGYVYELDDSTYTNAGDPLVRMRIAPHEAIPGRVRQFFSRFFLDCTTGEAPQGEDPQVELSWSNDSGATWSNPLLRSIGKVGERFARVLWTRLGMSRDRVWKLVFSGNAPFSIVDAGADTTAGSN